MSKFVLLSFVLIGIVIAHFEPEYQSFFKKPSSLINKRSTNEELNTGITSEERNDWPQTTLPPESNSDGLEKLNPKKSRPTKRKTKANSKGPKASSNGPKPSSDEPKPSSDEPKKLRSSRQISNSSGCNSISSNSSTSFTVRPTSSTRQCLNNQTQGTVSSPLNGTRSLSDADGLLDRAEYIFNHENFTDIEVVVSKNGNTSYFKVHRLFLRVSSPVLERLLDERENQRDTSPLVLTNVSPAVFRVLLYYMYKDDKSSRDDPDDWDVLIAAQKYQMQQLERVVIQKIVSKLTMETVWDYLVKAKVYKQQQIVQLCFRLLINRADKTFTHMRFIELEESDVTTVLNTSLLKVTEDIIFNQLYYWARHSVMRTYGNVNNREEEINEKIRQFLPYIHLEHLTPESFLRWVVDRKLLNIEEENELLVKQLRNVLPACNIIQTTRIEKLTLDCNRDISSADGIVNTTWTGFMPYDAEFTVTCVNDCFLRGVKITDYFGGYGRCHELNMADFNIINYKQQLLSTMAHAHLGYPYEVYLIEPLKLISGDRYRLQIKLTANHFNNKLYLRDPNYNVYNQSAVQITTYKRFNRDVIFGNGEIKVTFADYNPAQLTGYRYELMPTLYFISEKHNLCGI